MERLLLALLRLACDLVAIDGRRLADSDTVRVISPESFGH
jgi:hypothetical protein